MKRRKLQEATTFKVWLRKKVINWLNEDSKLYTKIMGEPVRKETVLLVNMIAVLLMVAAIAVEGSLIIAVIATICVGFLVRRLKTKEGKEKS